MTVVRKKNKISYVIAPAPAAPGRRERERTMQPEIWDECIHVSQPDG